MTLKLLWVASLPSIAEGLLPIVPMTTQRMDLLSNWRVLDLTEDGAMLAGKIFADLGAEVIKVEPPGGAPSRHRGPFLGGTPHLEKSLFWSALNLNKRSVTLDLAHPSGRARFLRLVQTSDLVIESFAPGRLDSLSLGYRDLSQAHPPVVLTSITPFGRSGPFASYKSPDLVSWAMSGYMWMTGDPSRAPLRPGGIEQAAQYAAVSSVGATLIALQHRARTGRGRHVDQSIEQLGPWMLFQSFAHYIAHGTISKRGGVRIQWGKTLLKQVHACKDGYLYITMGTGILSRGLVGLVEWMKADGMAPPALHQIDSATYDPTNLEQADADALSDALAAFFLTKTKQELLEGALARGLFITPINTIPDVVTSDHFKGHGLWQGVAHPERANALPHPASPVRFVGEPADPSAPAPAIGRDNNAIFTALLGLPSGSAPTQVAPPQAPKRKPIPKGGTSPSKPLDGIKVLDLTATVAGPVVTRLLADYGATVVKIESDARPDSSRTSTPYVGAVGMNHSLYYPFSNSSKYSFGIDMSKPGAAGFIKKHFAPWADVVIDSFAPGVMEKWGLAHRDIAQVNPKVIMARIAFIGHEGPLRNLKGFGNNASALSGISYLTAWEDGPPIGPYLAYGDHLAAYYTLAAVLAALHRRERTGQGSHIQVSILGSILSLLAPSFLEFAANGVARKPMGDRDDLAAPHGVYPCRGDDEWCAIAVTSDAEWQALAQRIGEPWASDPRFATLKQRREQQVELDRLMSGWTSAWDKHKLMRALQASGIPAGAVQNYRDLFSDPQLKHRGHFVRLNHPEMGLHYTHTSTFRLSDVDPSPTLRAPLLGEHTYSICKDFLGLPENEIATLFDQFLQ